MEGENGGTDKSKMEDYQVIEQIGRGTFGATFLVLHRFENQKYELLTLLSLLCYIVICLCIYM